MIGLDVGEAETEAFWRSFLRSLVERGLTGVQLVVSDAHAGLKKTIAQVLGCPWQRCTVHSCARRSATPAASSSRCWPPHLQRRQRRGGARAARRGARAAGKPLPKIAALLAEAEEDLLAFYALPADHGTKLRSTNPLE